MKKAIDVSKYQGTIDWDKVKAAGVEFAVIRCGWGNDLKKQDDPRFERNWAECQRVGIPCTAYFFSYAAAKNGNVDSELAHIKRLMAGKKANCAAPVYIDVENAAGLNWRTLSDEAMLETMKRFKEGLEQLGFKMGIYSSRSAFWNEKMRDPWYEKNVSVWVAEYAPKVNCFDRKYDLWQYTSSGRVNGIQGNVDLDRLYADFSLPGAASPQGQKSVDTLAREVIRGLWGNGSERRQKLTAAGYDYGAVQKKVNQLMKKETKA